MTIFLASIAVALLVSFFCSLVEATLLSLTPAQVAQLSERHPAAGQAWRGFKREINRPIAVILILNTTAHTIGASVAGAQFDELWGDRWIWVFSLALTFVMLQFTEILPKSLGVQLNTALAPFIARPLGVALVAFAPVVWTLHLLNRPFERSRKGAGDAGRTVDEIASLAALARMSKDIGSHQERIILGATRLQERRVRDLMIPLEHVVMLSDDLSLPRAIVAAHLDAHTRFPVHEAGAREKVVGYINFKEMIYFMSANPRNPTLKGIVRPVNFVSPDATATELMKVFVDQHEHIAIVRDSDGKALGLVTLEDLVEELIGDIGDEFDRLPRYSHPLAGGTWLFGGGVPMDEVAQCTAGALPAGPGSFADFISGLAGDAPRGGQTLRSGPVSILVRRVRRGRVFEASVSPAAA